MATTTTDRDAVETFIADSADYIVYSEDERTAIRLRDACVMLGDLVAEISRLRAVGRHFPET